MRRAALGALLLLAAACRTPVPAGPGPLEVVPGQLWESWQQEARQRESLRGRARLAVDRAGEALPLRGKQIVVLERPSRLRVELLGLFNQSIAVLVTDGERFELFRASDRSYDTGEVEPHLLWREAGIALSPSEAVGVLLGAPLIGDDWVAADAERVGDEIRIRLDDARARVQQRLAFDRSGQLLAVERFGADGQLLWRAGFDDYRDVGGQAVAHEVSLDVTAGETHAEIRLADIELNPDLPPDIFRLRRPGTVGGAVVDGEGG